MFDFIRINAPRLPADAVRAARKAAFDAAASAPRLLDRNAFAEAASTLQAWPKAVLAVEEGDVFAATLVAGDPAAGFLNLGRTLDL